jgi:hypothetical protein
MVQSVYRHHASRYRKAEPYGAAFESGDRYPPVIPELSGYPHSVEQYQDGKNQDENGDEYRNAAF